MQQIKNTRAAGFTLIELMIAVVIIGILSAVAYPAFQRKAFETRRSDAYIALSQLANDMEKFYSACSAYTDQITVARNCTPAGLGRPNNLSPNGYYQLAIALPAAGTYSLTATPVAGGKQAGDTECTGFTLTNTGQKSATGSNISRCWRQ